MTSDADLNDALKYHIDVDHNGTRRYRNSADLLHRDEGPAIVYKDGSEKWYQNGELHCTTGPAVIWAYGDLEWWQNGKQHREDGPAVEWHNGSKFWFQNGSCHRVNGPAVVWANGHVEWRLYGQEYTEQGYHEKLAELGIAK